MSVQAETQAKARKVVHADIKPENPAERAAHYIDAPNMPWETTKFPGIKIKVLYTDNDGATTALFSSIRRHRAAARAHRARADLCDRGLARRSRGQMRPGTVRLASGRQSARSGRSQRRRAARLLPQAEPLRLRRKILHGERRALSHRRYYAAIAPTRQRATPPPPHNRLSDRGRHPTTSNRRGIEVHARIRERPGVIFLRRLDPFSAGRGRSSVWGAFGAA